MLVSRGVNGPVSAGYRALAARKLGLGYGGSLAAVARSMGRFGAFGMLKTLGPWDALVFTGFLGSGLFPHGRD